SPFPKPSPQGSPEALPSPILRRLSSTSESRAVPCAAWCRGCWRVARGGWRGWSRGGGAKCRFKFLYVNRRPTQRHLSETSGTADSEADDGDDSLGGLVT